MTVDGAPFVEFTLGPKAEALVDRVNGDHLANVVPVRVRVPCIVLKKTVDVALKHTDSGDLHPELRSAVGFGPTNPMSGDRHHVDTSSDTKERGEKHGSSDPGKNKKANAEPALVNFMGFTYTGNVCGGVSGDRSVLASLTVGHDALCEPHTNDVGN